MPVLMSSSLIAVIVVLGFCTVDLNSAIALAPKSVGNTPTGKNHRTTNGL
jgi:hypothetical protein